jgi:hypothetical protein
MDPQKSPPQAPLCTEAIALRIKMERGQVRTEVWFEERCIYKPPSIILNHIYALLALARSGPSPERLINAEELKNLPACSNSTVLTVRKNFGTRHRQELEKAGLSTLILYEKAHKAWRFALPPAHIQWQSSVESVRAVIGVAPVLNSASQRLESGKAQPYDWAQKAIRCQIATDYAALGSPVHSLKVDEPTRIAYAEAAILSADKNPLQELVARFLLVRVFNRRAEEAAGDALEKLTDAIEAHRRTHTGLGEALHRRIRVQDCFARRGSAHEIVDAINELTLLRNEANAAYDFAALAMIEETLAILLIRQAPFNPAQRARASELYQSAITLYVHSRDTLRLQACLHNVAAFETTPTTSWRAPALQWQVDLVELADWYSDQVSLIASSGQTSCLHAMVRASFGDFERAYAALEKADLHLRGITNEREHAHRAYAQAHVHWWEYDLLGKQAEHHRAAIHWLKLAASRFKAIPDYAYGITLACQLHHLEAGVPLTQDAMQAAFAKR